MGTSGSTGGVRGRTGVKRSVFRLRLHEPEIRSGTPESKFRIGVCKSKVRVEVRKFKVRSGDFLRSLYERVNDTFDQMGLKQLYNC